MELDLDILFEMSHLVGKTLQDAFSKKRSAQLASGVEDYMQNLFSVLMFLVVTSTSRPWLESI